MPTKLTKKQIASLILPIRPKHLWNASSFAAKNIPPMRILLTQAELALWRVNRAEVQENAKVYNLHIQPLVRGFGKLRLFVKLWFNKYTVKNLWGHFKCKVLMRHDLTIDRWVPDGEIDWFSKGNYEIHLGCRRCSFVQRLNPKETPEMLSQFVDK